MKIPHYEIFGSQAGSGDWITMLHGQSQHSGLFNAQIEHFGHGYRLLLIDLPGHGKSSEMAGPYGQVEYAEAVLAVLDAVGVHRTHMWGTHTGSAISLLIANSHPDRVSSLILEGAVVPGMPMPYVTQSAARAKSTTQARGVVAARAEWFNECEWFDVIRSNPVECRAEAHWRLLMEFAGKPWQDSSEPAEAPSLVSKVHQIQHPTLLVNGELDVPEFLGVASTLELQLPRTQRSIVTGAGGFPLWEFPSVVNRVVDQFLEAHRVVIPPIIL